MVLGSKKTGTHLNTVIGVICSNNKNINLKITSLIKKFPMKTKNFLLTGALLIVALFSVNSVMADAPETTNGTTKVNIVLNGIQAITVSGSEVNLVYTSIENYNNGVETDINSHLTVYSVGPFAVKVTSDGIFKKGDKSISAGTVTITAEKQEDSPGTTSPVTIATGSATTGMSLISSTTGGFNKNYDVTYKHEFTDEEAAFKNTLGIYTAIVTYDISPS